MVLSSATLDRLSQKWSVDEAQVEEAAGWEVEGEREHKGRWNTNIDVPVSSPRTTERLCSYGAHMGASMQQPVAGCCSRTISTVSHEELRVDMISVLLNQGADAHLHPVTFGLRLCDATAGPCLQVGEI